jgi:hypothetical protein
MNPSPPRFHAWIVPDRIAVAERPGGGGRSHRRARRESEIAWWWEQGVRGVASGMRSRHGLMDYSLAGFAIRWSPLTDLDHAPDEMSALIAAVLELGESAPVLVHVDYANEWLAGVDARLRLALELASDPRDALLAAAADGLPVGPLAQALVAAVPAVAGG